MEKHIRSKVGAASLMLGSFLVGAFAFNAFPVDAHESEQIHPAPQKGEMLRKKRHYTRHHMGLHSEEVNREIIDLENGFQITITSDDPEIVKQLHEHADHMREIHEKMKKAR